MVRGHERRAGSWTAKTYLLVAGAALCLAAGGARAETLADAVRAAYEYNPTLVSQRAQLRALNETYVQARATLRPKLGVHAEASWKDKDSKGEGLLGASLDAPIYTGGRGAAQISAAEADIYAGREALRESEGQVMLSVVSAFVQVRYQERQLQIRQENLKSLEDQLATTQAQYNVREVTRTDLALFQASVEESRANLSSVEGDLAAARAVYRQLVGHDPASIDGEATLPSPPANLDAAMAALAVDNPSVRAARYAVQAADARVALARAERLPSIGVQSGVGYNSALGNFDLKKAARSLAGLVSLDVPIYQGGALNSQVRQNGATRDSRKAEVERVQRDAVTNLAEAWSRLGSNTSSMGSNEARLTAAKTAFEGTWEERRVGLRTSLEVLSAQQALTNAQSNLLLAQRDRTILTAQVLNAMGRLNAAALAPGLTEYDPVKDFRSIKYAGWTPLDPLIVLIDGIGVPHLDVLPRGSELPAGAIPLN